MLTSSLIRFGTEFAMYSFENRINRKMPKNREYIMRLPDTSNRPQNRVAFKVTAILN